MGFQPPSETAFAGRHPAHYARKDGDEVRHTKLSDTLSLLRRPRVLRRPLRFLHEAPGLRRGGVRHVIAQKGNY